MAPTTSKGKGKAKAQPKGKGKAQPKSQAKVPPKPQPEVQPKVQAKAQPAVSQQAPVKAESSKAQQKKASAARPEEPVLQLQLEALPGGWREQVNLYSPKYADVSEDRSANRTNILCNLLRYVPPKKVDRKRKRKAVEPGNNTITEEARLKTMPILTTVLPYLDQTDVLNLAQTCKSMYTLLSNGDFRRWSTVRNQCGYSRCTVNMTPFHEQNAQAFGMEYLDRVPKGHTENVFNCARCGRATCENCTAVSETNPRILETLFITSRYLCDLHVAQHREVLLERCMPSMCNCHKDYPRFCFPCHDLILSRGRWYTGIFVRAANEDKDKPRPGPKPKRGKWKGKEPGPQTIKVKTWCRCGEPTTSMINVFCDLCGGQHRKPFEYDID